METIMIAASVLTTLGIVLVIWLISSVRSLQKQMKTNNAEISDMHYSRNTDQSEISNRFDNIYGEIDNRFNNNYDEIDKRFDKTDDEIDKRFDNSYRTIYDLRDSIQSDVDRLIERDLELSKTINK